MSLTRVSSPRTGNVDCLAAAQTLDQVLDSINAYIRGYVHIAVRIVVTFHLHAPVTVPTARSGRYPCNLKTLSIIRNIQ